MKRFL